jgi:hypothetical protein
MITGNKTAAGPADPALPFLVRAAEHQGFGCSILSVFPAGAEPWRAMPSLGSAKPIACDATAESDLDVVAGSGTKTPAYQPGSQWYGVGSGWTNAPYRPSVYGAARR